MRAQSTLALLTVLPAFLAAAAGKTATADAPTWYYDAPQVMFDPDGPPPWHEAKRTGNDRPEPRGYRAPKGISSGTCDLSRPKSDITLSGRLPGPLGRAMKTIDRACLAQALEYAANRMVLRWRNTGAARFTVHINGAVQAAQRGYCRDFTVSTLLEGLPERISAAACRKTGGHWRLVR